MFTPMDKNIFIFLLLKNLKNIQILSKHIKGNFVYHYFLTIIKNDLELDEAAKGTKRKDESVEKTKVDKFDQISIFLGHFLHNFCQNKSGFSRALARQDFNIFWDVSLWIFFGTISVKTREDFVVQISIFLHNFCQNKSGFSRALARQDIDIAVHLNCSCSWQ